LSRPGAIEADGIAYTSSLNVLDLPSVVVPVTFADKDVDKLDPNYTPLTEKDSVNMALCMSMPLFSPCVPSFPTC
jgi:hypothetical protein